MTPAAPARPLAGLRVLELGALIAGPFCAKILAEFGADVVKVEPPGLGDPLRRWRYLENDTSLWWHVQSRGKRSITVDLRKPAGQAIVRALALSADIVVENFRAGTMEKFGLDYETMRASKPDLIYCSITGFGRDRGAALPGYDLLVQAVGGLMSVTGPGPDEPTKVGVALVDVLAGLHALVGILAALAHRDRTGQGQRVDIDLLSVLLSSLVNQASGYLGAGAVPGIMGNRHPSIAPYQTFPTADRPIALAVGNDKQFRLLAEAVNLPWLADDTRFASNPQRVHNRDALAEALGAVLKMRSADYWYETLTTVGVPAGPINNIAEAFMFAEQLGLTVSVPVPASATPQVAYPISLSQTPVSYRSAPPPLGDATPRE